MNRTIATLTPNKLTRALVVASANLFRPNHNNDRLYVGPGRYSPDVEIGAALCQAWLGCSERFQMPAA
jgi:hypothetical protein